MIPRPAKLRHVTLKHRLTVDPERVAEVFGVTGRRETTEWARKWATDQLREAAIATDGAVVSVRRDGA